jgi:hypothetical protein
VEILLEQVEAIRRTADESKTDESKTAESTSATLGEGAAESAKVEKGLDKSTATATAARAAKDDDRLRVLFVLQVVDAPPAAAKE